MEHRALGRTGLSVTPICFGTSPLGGNPELMGYDVSADQAVATITRVLEGPITFIDTSNNYGDGRSEERIGTALAAAGGVPPGFVLATKVDPVAESSDFSGARVRESVRESCARLGVDHFELVYLHDPERITFEEATRPDGPVQALIALRDEGVIAHLGIAGGPIDLERQFLELGVFEVVLTHNRYTLIDQSAEPLLEEAAASGVAVVNAAPYGGGILVRGADAFPKYAYAAADDHVLATVRAMQAACERHGVPLAAAALQFSLREPRIASTVVGMSAPQRVDQTLELAAWPIDVDLWGQLDDLAAASPQGGRTAQG